MQIGNIHIPRYPLLLAPMEDVTDRSFRYICKRYGADMLYTEFVASEAIIRNIKKSMAKLQIDDIERPVGIQLYGHDIDAMVESAKIAEAYNPDLIDINFGCPVKKIATRGAGSGMLRDVPKLLKMTSEIVKAVNVPVTVKTRLGWDDSSKIIHELAEPLQDTGIQALTIHGRTRAQLYTGVADWSLIGEIKRNPRIRISIIGNGDVKDGASAREKINQTGVDAIMIGRAAIGKPWIFNQIRHFLETGEHLPEPSIAERIALAFEHFDKSLELKDEMRGVYEMRRHFALYFKGLPNFKPLRLRLLTAMKPDDIKSILQEILETYQDFDINSISLTNETEIVDSELFNPSCLSDEPTIN